MDELPVKVQPVCVGCGKTFVRPKYKASRYCSKECSRNALAKSVTFRRKEE